MGDLKAQPQTILKTDLSEGYKDTEIGSLPEEWEVVRLEEVATFVMGQSPSSDTYNVSGSGLPFLQGKAEFGDVYPQPVKWCSSPLKVSPEGAILVSVRAPVGDVNIAPYKCCIGRGLAAIQPTTEADTKYLFYCLGFHKNRFEEQSSGSTFKSINKGVLKNFLTPLPPLPEQKAIAHVLSTVQKAIETNEQVIEASRELKRSLMNHLFTYGPVSVDEAEQVPFKETEIGQVPEHWEVTELGKITRVSTGTTPSTKRSDYYSGHIPFIKTSEIANVILDSAKVFVSEQAMKDYRLKLYEPGTVFLAMYGQGKTRGQVALLNIKATTTQNTAAIVSGERVKPLYLWMYLMSQYEALRGEGIQGQISHLNLGYVKRLQIPLPPISEQQEISQVLSAVEQKIAVEENRKQSLSVLFKTLLHNLMTGQVRVNDLDLSTVEEMT